MADENEGKKPSESTRFEGLENKARAESQAGSRAMAKRACAESPSRAASVESERRFEPAAVVGVWETDPSRWPLIEDTCAKCSACVQRICETEGLAKIAESQRYTTAIVALRDLPGTTDTCLDVVARLKDAGFCVIAYENGTSQWPVVARCQVLLAGARYLLDSNDPAFGETLGATLRDLLDALAARRNEEKQLREVALAHGIVGRSGALLEAFRQTARLSRLSDLPVLITGESGTGKELFACALHALDPKRSRGPFLAVNCAAINAGVAESELFGHVRGAFTGAGRDHSGFFSAAQGGVLFLDEIGELSVDVQAKILRVVQEKRLVRVGSEKDVPVDIRIIAATNQDLGSMVEQNRFRADLFHRLNSLSVRISPLRERLEDLPLLVDHFVSAHESWWKHTGIDRDLIDSLSCLELKGNVRELKNLITAALAAKTDHSPLGLKDLPQRVWQELSGSKFSDAARPNLPLETQAAADARSMPSDMRSLALRATQRNGWNLDHCLSLCEREIVLAALHEAQHNQSEAARLLGLTPRSVYNKLRKHQLLRNAMR
jgi:DNA-binding NtrC family response regulator